MAQNSKIDPVQEELRVSEERLSLALSGSEMGLWDWDVVSGDVHFNRRWAEMIGYEPDDIVPHVSAWEDLVHPDDLEEIGAVLKSHLEGHTPYYESEHRLRTKTGEWKWILDRGKVVSRDANGNPLRAVGIHMDIDDRKRVEHQIREAKERAEAYARAKGEFLANMSHEIRTPMTAILGYAENLLQPFASEEEKAEAAETIIANGEHLLSIINDILDLSKVEAGKLYVERIPCSPFDVTRNVEQLLKVRAEDKNLELRLEYLTEVPETVLTDPTRLRQILINLVGNAIKFTARGTILVTIAFHEGNDACEPTLDFCVVDSGIGMKSEQIARLFEPFSQADSSTTRRYGGTGLGLTISKRLTELLGGELVVHSVEGRGTLFRVSVPTGPVGEVRFLAEPPTSKPAAPRSALVEKLELRAKILLAEDNVVNQRLMIRILERAGASVTVVSNGEDAVEAALKAKDSASPFDVVLMDMQMPILDGHEATQLLRKKDYALPIIALTAHAMASDREKCLLAGCSDFISKPVKATDLVEIIDRICREESRLLDEV